MIQKLIEFDYDINNKKKEYDKDFDYKILSWYSFIIDNEKIFEIILEKLENSKIKKFLNIDKSIIKSIYSVSILKSFENSFDKKENDITYLDFIDSDMLINNIILNLNKYFIYIEICKNNKKIIKNSNLFSLDNQKDRQYIYKIIRFDLKDIIKAKLVRIKKKTKYLYTIDDIKNKNKINYISKKEYNIIKIFSNNELNIYQYSNHLSSIEEVFIKNISNESIDIINLEEFYKNVQEIEIFYDKNFLKDNLNIILENFNSVNKTNILIEDIEKNYDEIRNIWRIHFTKNIEISSKIQEKLSNLLRMINMKKICSMDIDNVRIYLPIKLDFRGRFYYTTNFSPTFNWELRSCIYYGNYQNSNDYIKIENMDKIENILNEIWKNNEQIILKILPNLEKENKKIKESAIWIIMSIGKIFTKTNNKKFIIKDEEFFKNGISSLINDLNIEEIKKKIELNYYKKVLLEINNRIYKKRPIFKDATASVFQHLIKLCGYKNEDSLKFVNVSSNEWCDTYSKIIVMFFSKIKSKELEDDEINLIFNRDNLKSTIMTEKYAAGEKKCYEYFKKKTEKIVSTYDIKKKKEIRKIFTKFYYFLKKIDFFEYSIDKSKEYFKERNYNFNLKDAKINLLYTKTYTKQWEIKNKNTRIAKKYIIKSNEIDINETEKGVMANYIHAQDSAFARKLCWIYKVIAIHDCFLIDYLNTTYFIYIANKIFKEKFDENLKSKEISNELFNLFILV